MMQVMLIRGSFGFLFGMALYLAAMSQAIGSSGNDFSLPDLDGNTHALSDYRGKWVLVNYWATWCPPCREELPELEMFHSRSDGEAAVLGVNMEDIEVQPLRRFVDEQFLSYPVLVAGSQPQRSQLLGPVPGLPTSYLVSPEGKVVARQVGTVTADGLREFIESYNKRQLRDSDI